MPTEKDTLLQLTREPYTQSVNTALAAIKKQLGPQRTKKFESELEMVLPFTTGREAFRSGILVAIGEKQPTLPRIRKEKLPASKKKQ